MLMNELGEDIVPPVSNFGNYNVVNVGQSVIVSLAVVHMPEEDNGLAMSEYKLIWKALWCHYIHLIDLNQNK